MNMMSTCRWCTPVTPGAADLLQKYGCGSLTLEDEQAVSKDLCFCLECVVEYHRVRDELPSLHKRLWKLETSRLQARFSQASEEELEEDDLLIVEDDQEIQVPKFTAAEYENFLRVPLTEILKYPYLMGHPKLCEMCVEALCKMEKTNSFQVFDKYGGIYLLLVHPNETVRRWAIRTARSLGKVDRDDFYDLQDIFTSMFCVIELDLFQNSDIDTSYDPASSKMVCLPSHLYDSSNYKNYWLGICMLLTVLDAQAMDSLLLGPDKQTDIMQCILNTMEKAVEDEGMDPFWPALQCFMVILDRLGSKIWGQVIEPAPAFQTITGSHSYTREIDNIRQKTMMAKVKMEMGSDDDTVTCSQIIYDSNIKEKKKGNSVRGSQGVESGCVIYEEMQSLIHVLQSDMGQDMRVHNSTFLWFIPFVQSVMDLNDLSIVYIGEIIHYLCGEIKDLINGRVQTCDKVTEFFILILVFIVELHLNKNRMKVLYYSAPKWVEVIVKCATLPCAVFHNSVDSGSHRVSSTSSLKPLSRSPQVSTVVPQACMLLIRSLLKEGGKLTSHCKSMQFLDLLNKQIREMPLKEWSLMGSDVKELQNCLKCLVKLMRDKTPAAATGIVENVDALTPPPSNNPAEPYAQHCNYALKYEQRWDGEQGSPKAADGRDNAGFRTGETDVISIKKEPHDPDEKFESVGELKAPLQVTKMVPDPGKVEELKSKLSPALFSKLQIIAKKQSGHKNLTDNISSDVEQSNLDRISREPLNTFVGGQEPDSSRPSTSGAAVAQSSVFAREGSEYGDDLSLSTKNFLKKTQKSKHCETVSSFQADTDNDRPSVATDAKEPKYCVHSSPESSHVKERREQKGRKKRNAATDYSQDLKDRAQPAMDVIVISDSDSTREDNDISVSSQKEIENQCRKQKLKVKSEHLNDIDQDHELQESPSHCDLSEYDSQLFEFETQDYIFSAWGDHGIDGATPEAERGLSTVSEQLVSPGPSDLSHNLGYDTEPVSDEMIENAVLQAEQQAQQQKCSLEHQKSSSEKRDVFLEPKPLHMKNSGKGSPYRKKQAKSSVTSMVSRTEQPNKKTDPKSTLSRFVSELPTSSLSTPAIVPPKKVRKPVEPTSAVEKLGLKKKERKAFDLSQRSLHCVGQLRKYGQGVQVEQKKQTRRTRKSRMISPQKLTIKGNKKLLASQDLQFFRQSRAKPQSFRITNLSYQTAEKRASDKTSKTNSKWNDILKPHTVPEDEEDSSVFPPLLRPDTVADHSGGERSTDRRSQEKLSTPEISSIDSHLGFSTTMCKDPLYSGGHRLQAKEVIDDVKTDAAVDKDDVGKHFEDNLRMCPTQIEPVDMELCSQVEDDDDLFLTQRDPVDMDIDAETETYEGKSPGMDQAKERLDVVVSPQPESPVQKSSTSHKGDDHLFLKPGMSPMSLKKAKPSTTKIYAPSSRSATLVQEMEKTSKPLPSAAVAKSKFARPEVPVRRTGAPQPEFRQPPLKHPVSSHSIQNSAVGSSPQVPSYKIYARPETPISREVPRMDASHKFDQSVLIQTVLKWTYDMFCSYTQFGVPSDLCSIPLREVASTYRSYDEYFETFYPLLLINTFEELVNDWIKNTASGQLITHHLQVVGIEYSNKIANASFTACLSSQDAAQQLYPKEDDLVILWLPQNMCSYSRNESEPMERHACFGCVSRSNLFSGVSGKNQTLNLTIQTRGNVSSVNNQVVTCQLVGSLVSAIREFRALYLLKTNIMFRPLLAPQLTYFQPGHEKISIMSLPEFNPEQVKAISWGLSVVKHQQRTPKICLIHGPPGTGKSKTIVGLLHCLFSGGHENLSAMGKGLPKAGRLRVLLCAPSNAAIDSLMKKIIVVFKKNCRDIQNPQGNCGDINLVRLGMEKTISKHLKPFSLDNQTRVRTQKAQQGHEMDIQQRKVQLDQRIDQLSQHCAMEKKGTGEFHRLMEQKFRLLKEREQLGRQLKETRSRKQETQAKLLQGAHIICCTLSTSGSVVLESAFRRLGHEPFSCIIVDEAGQATEPETLIPMLYRCPALILVGDPEQLPPTVISQAAKEKKYDQSLMARLLKYLHRTARENPDVCMPLIFLRVQYRMHPEICQFPSMHVYGCTLETDRDTGENRRSNRWPFQPYRLFDVTDGRETKERESFCNHKEIKLVLFLIKMMLDKQIIKVGVITPYNAQKLRIQESLNREMAKEESKRLQVEVDTVDGFQGREMDCIIVSCVRASGEPGSIGFLGNRQRLNVTITRAKYSLFILGHLRTLREQRDWGALIQDAYKRGTIVKTHEKDFRTDAMQIFKRDSGLIRSLSYPPKEPGFPFRVGLTAEAPAFVSTEKMATGSTSASSAKEKAVLTTAHQVSDVHQVGGAIRGRGLLQRSDRPRDPRLAAQPPHPRTESREKREQGHSSSFSLSRALRGSREEHAVPHHAPGDWRHWDSHPQEQSRQTPPHLPHNFHAPYPQPPLKRPPDSHWTSDTSSKREKR